MFINSLYLQDKEQKARLMRKALDFLRPNITSFDLLIAWDERYPDLLPADKEYLRPEDVPHLQKLSRFLISILYGKCSRLLTTLIFNEDGIQFHCSALYHELIIDLCRHNFAEIEKIYAKCNYGNRVFYNKQWTEFKKCPDNQHNLKLSIGLWDYMHGAEPAGLKFITGMSTKVFGEYHGCFDLYLKILQDFRDTPKKESPGIASQHLDWMWAEDQDGHPRVLKILKATCDLNPNVGWIEKEIPKLFPLFLNYLSFKIDNGDVVPVGPKPGRCRTLFLFYDGDYDIEEEEVYEYSNEEISYDDRAGPVDSKALQSAKILTQLTIFATYFEAMMRNYADDVFHLLDPFSSAATQLIAPMLDKRNRRYKGGNIITSMRIIMSRHPYFFEYTLFKALTRAIQLDYIDPNADSITKPNLPYIQVIADELVKSTVPLKPDQADVIIPFFQRAFADDNKQDQSFKHKLNQWISYQKNFSEANFVVNNIKKIAGLLCSIDRVMQKRIVKPNTPAYSFYISNNITAFTSHNGQCPYLEFVEGPSAELADVFTKAGHQVVVAGNRLIFPMTADEASMSSSHSDDFSAIEANFGNSLNLGDEGLSRPGPP